MMIAEEATPSHSDDITTPPSSPGLGAVPGQDVVPQLVNKDAAHHGDLKAAPTHDDTTSAPKPHILKVTVYSADNLPKMDIISETDPFVTLKLGKTEFQTATLDNAGEKPLWREDFLFPTNPEDNDLVVTVRDQDVITSELIGKVTIQLDKVLAPICRDNPSKQIDQTFEFQEGLMGRDKHQRPRIRLLFEYIPLVEVNLTRRPSCPSGHRAYLLRACPPSSTPLFQPLPTLFASPPLFPIPPPAASPLTAAIPYRQPAEPPRLFSFPLPFSLTIPAPSLPPLPSRPRRSTLHRPTNPPSRHAASGASRSE
jgi:hypothetical protein